MRNQEVGHWQVGKPDPAEPKGFDAATATPGEREQRCPDAEAQQAQQEGPGNTGGGGGNGGNGGSSFYGSLGGVAYGSLSEPTDLGSGGGAGTIVGTKNAAGGAGGGALFLIVTGTLQLDGRVSADGNAATDQWGG